MRTFRSITAITALLLVTPSLSALAADNAAKPAAAPSATPAPKEKCEHGVDKKLCTRCNPKLAAVFKAKGDWCHEHNRPESQCAICHPELEKQGVKP